MSYNLNSAVRVWYSTGFDPECAEESGGLERVTAVLPECLLKIRHRHPAETGKGCKQLAEEYSGFCTAVFDDLHNSFEKPVKWENHPAIKPLYDAQNEYIQSYFSWVSPYGPSLCLGESLSYIACGGICSSLLLSGAASLFSRFTNNPVDLGLAGFIGGSLGFVGGFLALPLGSILIGLFHDSRPGIRKAKKEAEEKSVKKFLQSIDEYLANTQSIG